MPSRVDLQTLLEDLLGSEQVYYQPPSTISMTYPAIVYSRRGIDNSFANDAVYKQELSYDITVIDKNPDSQFVYAVSRLPRCKFNRNYRSDNLNHDVFTIIY